MLGRWSVRSETKIGFLAQRGVIRILKKRNDQKRGCFPIPDDFFRHKVLSQTTLCVTNFVSIFERNLGHPLSHYANMIIFKTYSNPLVQS